MTKIAILGAAGQIAQLVEPMILKKTDVDIVLICVILINYIKLMKVEKR